ncbi:MAG: hypothetical protein GY772_31885 [bacterium]|nr:hypothetical protein [bacterium]
MKAGIVDVGGSAPVAEPPPAAARDAGGSAPVTEPLEPRQAAAAAAQATFPRYQAGIF